VLKSCGTDTNASQPVQYTLYNVQVALKRCFPRVKALKVSYFLSPEKIDELSIIHNRTFL
jgi:hypothetical protein